MSTHNGAKKDREESKRLSRSEDPLRQAWRLLFDMSRGMKSRLEATYAKFDLSFQQGMFLHHLSEGGPRQMNEFAELLHCDASNVTGLVDRLEGRGLLSRQASDQDRRVKLLVLTAEGQKVRESILEEIMEPPAALRRLSMADQKALRDILQRAWDVAAPKDVEATKTGG